MPVGVGVRPGAIISHSAEVAQLVERNLAKVEVAGSSPVFRSNVDQSMLKVREDHGDVAEWLGTGLQNLLPRFNSGRRLQHISRALSSAGERFPDTEEVTGSIPVGPTPEDPLFIRGSLVSLYCIRCWSPTSTPRKNPTVALPIASSSASAAASSRPSKRCP